MERGAGAVARSEQTSDFLCVTGWSVDDVQWDGFRLQTLSRAGPQPKATHLAFVSLEKPYVDTLSLKQAFLPDVLVADRWTASRCTKARRAARLVIPQMYGYKGVKWLPRIHATDPAAARLLGAARLRPRRLGGRSNGLG